jgi:hypothetical protein
MKLRNLAVFVAAFGIAMAANAASDPAPMDQNQAPEATATTPAPEAQVTTEKQDATAPAGEKEKCKKVVKHKHHHAKKKCHMMAKPKCDCGDDE